MPKTNHSASNAAIFGAINCLLLGPRSGLCVDVGNPNRLDHVYVIVHENSGFDDALYGPSPFLFKLAMAKGLGTYYFGVTHPSLPNYLAMVTGDDFGVSR